MAELEKFIPLKDAAQKYGLQMHVLTDLVEKGKLRALRINHMVIVAEGEVFELVKATNGNGKKYAKLEGKPIRLTRAADKYQISPAALSGWTKRGYIRAVERGPKLLLLNEADVARAKDLAELLGMRRGRGVIEGPVYPL
jgi:predicted site-specific integrase-resolvase